MVERAGGGPWTSLLEAPLVREALNDARIVRAVHPVPEAASTQDVARELAARGVGSGTLVVTDHQTAGRGRGGRRWDDRPDGGTLALTLLLDIAGPGEVALAPHALGLALLDAFAAALPRPTGVRIKWPNDLVHRGDDGAMRKLCGILIERERAGGRDVLLCGVGVDVDLRGAGEVDGRTCLATLAGAPPERERLLAAVISGLDAAVPLLADPVGLLDRYRAVSDTIGRTVRVDLAGGATIVGLAADVDEGGRLVVTTDGGRHVILSGTVRDAEDAADAEERES